MGNGYCSFNREQMECHLWQTGMKCRECPYREKINLKVINKEDTMQTQSKQEEQLIRLYRSMISEVDETGGGESVHIIAPNMTGCIVMIGDYEPSANQLNFTINFGMTAMQSEVKTRKVSNHVPDHSNDSFNGDRPACEGFEEEKDFEFQPSAIPENTTETAEDDAEWVTVKFPDIKVKVTDCDNAFAVLGKVSQAMKDAGIERTFIAQYQAVAMESQDFNDMLQICREWVQCE